MTTKPLALKWAAQSHVLAVDAFKSEEEAIRAAGWASDYGHEALISIDVWDDAGHRVIGPSEALDRAYAMQEEEARRQPPAPPLVARVVVRSPDGKAVTLDDYANEAEARAEAAALAEHLGDRVSVEAVPEQSTS